MMYLVFFFFHEKNTAKLTPKNKILIEHSKLNNSIKRMFDVVAHHIEKIACWGLNQYFFLSIIFPSTALKLKPYFIM